MRFLRCLGPACLNSCIARLLAQAAFEFLLSVTLFIDGLKLCFLFLELVLQPFNRNLRIGIAGLQELVLDQSLALTLIRCSELVELPFLGRQIANLCVDSSLLAIDRSD
ncbi:MAG: hypothetical protein A2286_01500 [Gammaproteobacteria bacterium RIFOXYA12_FULL_61_12]|nr:MAG: hypothetical protein A2514_10045 [Gammaproteobacteria bacterium RIFOXYD12_FULL_61_37]OGT91005.1 MAG: hypothetical protein A2286_01500 [Gammaproteobacteria bacterium RIFOXYA12_FULL_61_12]